MTDDYIQKKNGNELTFRFEETELVISAKLDGSKHSRNIAYGNISRNTSEFVERNDWLRNAGYLWIAIGILQEILFFKGGNLTLSVWLVLGIACLVIHYMRQTHFTVVTTLAGDKNILIIKDKDHDKILNEIFERRKIFFKKNYGEINFDNAPENEIGKFEYLFKEEVITEKELESNKKKISEHHKNKAVPSPISFI